MLFDDLKNIVPLKLFGIFSGTCLCKWNIARSLPNLIPIYLPIWSTYLNMHEDYITCTISTPLLLTIQFSLSRNSQTFFLKQNDHSHHIIHMTSFSSNLRCSFSVVSMVLLRHTLLTSCSRWRPWSHAEGCDPRPRPDWTSRGRDGLP